MKSLILFSFLLWACIPALAQSESLTLTIKNVRFYSIGIPNVQRTKQIDANTLEVETSDNLIKVTVIPNKIKVFDGELSERDALFGVVRVQSEKPITYPYGIGIYFDLTDGSVDIPCSSQAGKSRFINSNSLAASLESLITNQVNISWPSYYDSSLWVVDGLFPIIAKLSIAPKPDRTIRTLRRSQGVRGSQKR